MIILVTGVMAAGKSTVAQLVAEQLDRSVHVRGDLFRRMVVNGRAEPNTPAWDDELRMRYTQAAAAADRYADAGYDVVWQDCVIGPLLGEVKGWVRNRPFHIVVLAPNPSVVAHRDAHRHKRGYDSDWTVADLDTILHSETPKIGTWIDSSELTAGETAEQVLQACVADQD